MLEHPVEVFLRQLSPLGIGLHQADFGPEGAARDRHARALFIANRRPVTSPYQRAMTTPNVLKKRATRSVAK